MTIQNQIQEYINSQPDTKCIDMHTLHKLMLNLMPNCKLWFLDGKNNEGKVVANPNIGYGLYTIKYADATTRDFYQIGLSVNTTGISVYIMNIADKKYLPKTYAEKIGKASVSGYCIKFKKLEDIDIDVLVQMIKYGIEVSK